MPNQPFNYLKLIVTELETKVEQLKTAMVNVSKSYADNEIVYPYLHLGKAVKFLVSTDNSHKVATVVSKPTVVTTYSFKSPPDVLGSLAKGLSPGALSTIAVCPACKRKRALDDAIIHLNDDHRWERIAIADWLDTLDVDLRFKGAEDG